MMKGSDILMMVFFIIGMIGIVLYYMNTKLLKLINFIKFNMNEINTIMTFLRNTTTKSIYNTYKVDGPYIEKQIKEFTAKYNLLDPSEQYYVSPNILFLTGIDDEYKIVIYPLIVLTGKESGIVKTFRADIVLGDKTKFNIEDFKTDSTNNYKYNSVPINEILKNINKN